MPRPTMRFFVPTYREMTGTQAPTCRGATEVEVKRGIAELVLSKNENPLAPFT